MEKLRRIFDIICRDYQLGNLAPMIMPFILREPEKAERCFEAIKKVVNS